MVLEIMRDEEFLSIVSTPATAEDLPLAHDLLETLVFHKAGCVGMAANMVGVSKRIIAFADGEQYCLMFNPKIIKASKPYSTTEGCLSLLGKRKASRFDYIKVEFQNEKFQTRFKTYTGWTAQIIQHEIDHCDGIII